MKTEDIKKGLLVQKRPPSAFFGEVMGLPFRGIIVVKSYHDNCNHYMKLGRLQPLHYVIEPDGAIFHGYIPSLKGLRTCGDTEDETYNNLKEAVKAYIKSMIKHEEIINIKHRFDNWVFRV